MKIFNVKQANIFIKNNCLVISCGLGDKGKVFIEFKEDLNFYKMMTRWLNKEFN